MSAVILQKDNIGRMKWWCYFWICTKLIKSSFIKEEPAHYNILFNAVHCYELICHLLMTVMLFIDSDLVL